MGVLSLFKKNKESPENILRLIDLNRGLLWEVIAEFKETLQALEGSVSYYSDEMQEVFPVKHHLKDGLYTREIFMPKGSLVVSFIHLTNHPSFFMSGEMSVLRDDGEIKRIKAPMVVQTEIGTQRVAYMHEDCVWTCVYKTNKKTIKAAEKEVYTENYLDLPKSIIQNKKLLCQD
jgi:uncharacterized cupin superfamily protein